MAQSPDKDPCKPSKPCSKWPEACDYPKCELTAKAFYVSAAKSRMKNVWGWVLHTDAGFGCYRQDTGQQARLFKNVDAVERTTLDNLKDEYLMNQKCL